MIALASALYDELPLSLAGKPYNSRVMLSKAGLTITQPVPMPEQLPIVIVLSATAQADLLERIFHVPVEEHVFDVPPHPSTTHIALDTENKVWTRTAMYYGDNDPILCKGDRRSQQVSRHMMHEELTQAAGRLRCTCEPGKVLITVGCEQPDYVPEPQIEVKHMPVLTDDGTIKRDARKEESKLAFDAAYNTLKWRGKGKTVSPTALAKEAHRSKGAAIEYIRNKQKEQAA